MLLAQELFSILMHFSSVHALRTCNGMRALMCPGRDCECLNVILHPVRLT